MPGTATKRQKKGERIEKWQPQQLTTVLATCAFPDVPPIRGILMQYLVYSPFEAPLDRRADTLEDAQWTWSMFMGWWEERSHEDVWPFQGVDVVDPRTVVEGVPRGNSEAGIALWVRQDGGWDACCFIEEHGLSHVALVASRGTTKLNDIFTTLGEASFLAMQPTLQEVVLVLPGVETLGDAVLAECPVLGGACFAGMTGLTEVGSHFLNSCPMLEDVCFNGLGALRLVGPHWLRGCTRLLTADFSGLADLAIVRWEGNISMGCGPLGWLHEASRPLPPTLRLGDDGSLQVHRWLLRWVERCPRLVWIRFRNFGTFRVLSQGDWGVCEVDPLAYSW
jgi:hypothetical protein